MIIWKPFYKHDVQCLKSIRRIVVPLRNTNLPASWEEALHEWNFRVQHWSRAGNVSVTHKGKLQYYGTSGRKKKLTGPTVRFVYSDWVWKYEAFAYVEALEWHHSFTFIFALPGQRLPSFKGHGGTKLLVHRWQPKLARQECTQNSQS